MYSDVNVWSTGTTQNVTSYSSWLTWWKVVSGSTCQNNWPSQVSTLVACTHMHDHDMYLPPVQMEAEGRTQWWCPDPKCVVSWCQQVCVYVYVGGLSSGRALLFRYLGSHSNDRYLDRIFVLTTSIPRSTILHYLHCIDFWLWIMAELLYGGSGGDFQWRDEPMRCLKRRSLVETGGAYWASGTRKTKSPFAYHNQLGWICEISFKLFS